MKAAASSLARAAAALLFLSLVHGSQSLGTAFIRDSEVWIKPPGAAEARQVTNDGERKGLLAQSPGGTRLAFVRESAGEMADIIVMDMNGSLVNEIHFRPDAEQIQGMRGVENLQWISEKRLVLSGSINPSTCEYEVLEADTGKPAAYYLVDGTAWEPSPDGLHAAYIGFIPHFTPEEARRPQICLDAECGLVDSRGYPKPDIHLEFTTGPRWSADGTAVAVLAEDYTTHETRTIARYLNGKTRDVPAPREAEGSLGIRWDGDALVLLGSNGKWRLAAGSSSFDRVK